MRIQRASTWPAAGSADGTVRVLLHSVCVAVCSAGSDPDRARAYTSGVKPYGGLRSVLTGVHTYIRSSDVSRREYPPRVVIHDDLYINE